MSRVQNSGPDSGKRIWMWPAVLLLALGVLATAAAVCQRIGIFSHVKEADTVIELAQQTESQAETQAGNTDTVVERSTGSGYEEGGSAARIPGFRMWDDDGEWDIVTDIELFRVSYENGEAQVTAASADGQKIVAPGTEADYTFHLTNSGTAAVDYDIEASAIFTDGTGLYEIPLNVRFREDGGHYLAGDSGRWVSMEGLNEVSEKAVLGAGNYISYTLEWQWPYETGRDDYDTMLGNLAAGKELALTVILKVKAEQDTDPNAGGGIPQTGDGSDLWLYVVLAAVSAAVLLVYAFQRRPEKGGAR